MIPYFKRLGDSIERAWLERNYDETVFPQVIERELERDPPVLSVGVADILRWAFSAEADPQPADQKLFGEPPLVLFQAPRFYIEALFWFSGTTAIHQHAFSGVFMVLGGSSVHSHWRFAAEREINSRMLCGRLERESTEILGVGDSRPIRAGDQLIHQLFHLETPSVTLVIRTYEFRRHLPQYSYLLPGLAIDPDDRNGLRQRRLILLGSMARGQLEGLRESTADLMARGCLEDLYFVFSELSRFKADPGLLAELYDIARKRHGDVVDLLAKVCEEERRTRIVIALRSKVTDPDARFLLAVLMLMPDRDAVLDTVRLRFPELEPVAAVERCLEKISGKEIIGFEFNDVNQAIFRGLVEGAEVDEVLQRLQARFPTESIEARREALVGHIEQMSRLALFRPLFSRFVAGPHAVGGLETAVR